MLLRILAVCAVTACASNASTEPPGGNDEPADLDVIASQPAHGTIAGKTFTLGTRYMNISDGERSGSKNGRLSSAASSPRIRHE
jgi:hypothetical protein